MRRRPDLFVSAVKSKVLPVSSCAWNRESNSSKRNGPRRSKTRTKQGATCPDLAISRSVPHSWSTRREGANAAYVHISQLFSVRTPAISRRSGPEELWNLPQASGGRRYKLLEYRNLECRVDSGQIRQQPPSPAASGIVADPRTRWFPMVSQEGDGLTVISDCFHG